MASNLKNLKLKLQFTGWLQYLIPTVLAILFLLMGGILSLFSLKALTTIFLGIGGFLLILNLFDIVTIKFNIRPPERLPKRRDNLNSFDLMRARRACRSFQNRVLTSSDKTELLSKVQELNEKEGYLIGENPIRFEYIHAKLTVWPVVGAQEFLAAIAPKKYNRESIIDVGRDLQKVVHHATKMGLATCWIGPGADQTSIVSQLGDSFNPDEDHIICVCAIGYKSVFKPFVLRIGSKVQHRRLPLSSLFFTDPQLTKPIDEKIEPFSQFGRCFEVCQWAPSSFNAQPTRCSAVISGTEDGKSLKRFDFYAVTKSRYYAPVALGIWCANWEIGCEALGISGNFEVLSKDNSENSKLPFYDISWVLDDSMQI